MKRVTQPSEVKTMKTINLHEIEPR